MATTSMIGQAEVDFSSVPKLNKDMDKDAFLKLLVTQMQNQDPLSPTDDKEYMSQLAQFSSLEQLTNLNKGMTNMVASTNQGQLFSAVSYIGKHVSAPGDTIALGAVVDGEVRAASTVHYGTSESVVGGQINVMDTDGNIVYSEVLGPKTAGNYTFTWNGKDSNGNAAPAGYYGVAVGLENAEGKAVIAQTALEGKVTGVETLNGKHYLALEDGRLLDLTTVTFVSDKPPVASTDKDKTETETKTT